MSAANESTGGSVAGGNVSRARAFLFLIQFLVTTSALLIAHQYAMNSKANIAYLYVLSQSTSKALGEIGDSSTVEPYREQYPAASIRADLAEWGIIKPTEDTSPLTAWEFWRHSAARAMRQDVGLADHGPTVKFVAKKATESTPETAFNFRIIPDCGAIPSMAIFVSAVFAFPATWRKRFMGAALGLMALYTVNVGRLAMLAYIGAYDDTENDRIFTFVHEYVWQSVFLVFVVAVWLLWIEWLKRGGSEKPV